MKFVLPLASSSASIWRTTLVRSAAPITTKIPAPIRQTAKMGSLATGDRLFPPQLEAGLEIKLSKNYCLGTPQDKKLFAVTFPKGIFTKKTQPIIKLHAGPNEADATLATVDHEPGNKKTQLITVNRGDRSVEAKLTTYVGGWTDITHRFMVPCGREGQSERLEEFEWRMDTKDPNIKAIGAYGFNLVHISGGQEEVVAFVAMAKSLTMSKWYTFCFVGEGLTGAFGEAWEVATVAAGARVYQLEDLRIAGATAASAG